MSPTSGPILPGILLLALAACGGSDVDPSAVTDPVVATDPALDAGEFEAGTQPDGEGAADDQEQTQPDEGDIDVGMATVTLGDRTFQFELTITCFEMGGFLSFTGNAVDGSGWQVNGGLGGDPGDETIVVREVEGDERWEVNPDIYPGSEFVEVTHEGKSAHGRVIFADILGDTQEGSFEVACP